MTEFHFDPQEGVLLVGQTAIDWHVQAGGESVPLRDVLEAKDFPYEPSDHEPVTREWSRDDALAFGKWVLDILQADGQSRTLRTRHIRRLAVLGIGPPVKRIEVLFGYKINNFKEAIGSPINHTRGLFTEWTPSDYFMYAERLHKKIMRLEGAPRKLTRKDFRDAFAAQEGPALATIERQMGGTAQLNEHLGYPDIYGWDDEDYIAWGARLLRANPSLGGIGDAVQRLSRLKRGPSRRAVVDHFTSLIGFRWKAEEELKRQETARQERLAKCREFIAMGRLPEELLQHSESNILAAGARLRIFDHYERDLKEYRRRERLVEVKDSTTFVQALAKYGAPRFTAAEVEATAVMLGVYDDLWPVDDSYLCIDPPPEHE